MSENRKLSGLATVNAAGLDAGALTYIVLSTGESRKATIGEFATAVKTTGAPLPIVNGGTGATSSAAARTLLGLGSVDNTADLAKPISTATQSALNLKANTVSPALTGDVSIVSAGNSTLTLQSDTQSQIFMRRHITSVSPPTITMHKSRGTAAAPTAVAPGDLGLNLAAQGYDGVGLYRNIARLEARVRTATPGPTDMEGEWVFYTTPASSATAVETARIAYGEGVVANGFRTVGGVLAANGSAQYAFSVLNQRSGVFLLSAMSAANGYYAVALLSLHGGRTVTVLDAGGGVAWSISGTDILLTSLTGQNTTWSATRLG